MLNDIMHRKVEISADLSLCLKGFFAIVVLCHHLYQHSGLLHGTIIGSCFQVSGYLAVASFFFLSIIKYVPNAIKIIHIPF